MYSVAICGLLSKDLQEKHFMPEKFEDAMLGGTTCIEGLMIGRSTISFVYLTCKNPQWVHLVRIILN